MRQEDCEDDEVEEKATLQRAAFDPTPTSATSFTLVVLEGPDRDRTYVVDGLARVLVGQSEACVVRLSDREVSRRHLALESTGKRLRVTDLGSTNGTWIDGVAVIDGFVRGGEVVRLGATAIRIDPRTTPAVPNMLPSLMAFGALAGASTEMRRIYPLCERLAKANVPVVIEGETGTGKEVLAEAIHEMGPRADGPFVVFDCTAVPPSLLESELFGHERGAFTGAVATRRGVFEQAHGGTLLIDEIGDLELSLQPKLLRALERSEVRRVGAEKFMKVDVRVLAATRRDLDREVQAKRFRDDLFHRLAVGRIELPPLRRRKGDITLLATKFARELGGSVAPEWLLKWEDYEWPGNVRELRNVVARTLALGDLTTWDAPRVDGNAAVTGEGATPAQDSNADDLVEQILSLHLPLSEARQRLTEAFEQRYIDRVLDEHGGNVTRAAAAARVGRRHLQKLRAKR